MKRNHNNYCAMAIMVLVCASIMIVGCGRSTSKKHSDPCSGKCVVYPEAKDVVDKYAAQNPDEYIIKTGTNSVKCQYASFCDSTSVWYITINYDSLITIKAQVDPANNILYYAEISSDGGVMYEYSDSAIALAYEEEAYIHDKIDPVLVQIAKDSLEGEYQVEYQWTVTNPEKKGTLFEVYIDEYNPLISEISTFAIYANIDSEGRVTHYSNNQWVTLYQDWEWHEYYEERIRRNLDPVIKGLTL